MAAIRRAPKTGTLAKDVVISRCKAKVNKSTMQTKTKSRPLTATRRLRLMATLEVGVAATRTHVSNEARAEVVARTFLK